MSVVRMSKMSLAAHGADRGSILRLFLKLGCVEISSKELTELTSYPDSSKRLDEISQKLLRISFALNFIKDCAKQLAVKEKDVPKVNVKRENKLVALEDYESAEKGEGALFERISRLDEINSRLNDIKSELIKNASLAEQLIPYTNLDIRFGSVKNTKNTVSFLGTIPANNIGNLKEKLDGKALIYCGAGDKLSAVYIITHIENCAETTKILSENEFIKCAFDFSLTANEKIAELDQRKEELNQERTAKLKEALSFSECILPLKVLYDYYVLEKAKLDCLSACPHTKKAFVMEAWVPKDKTAEIEASLKKICRYTAVEFRDPTEGDNPPSLVQNNKLVQPFNEITKTFGSPAYNETDPNLFVAIFYFLIFGIMMGDAGYGFIISAVSFGAYIAMKPVKGGGKMLIVFGLCGISTFVWGALFGGWFGVSPQSGILNKITWFSPLDAPLKMFMLALLMGVLQIGTGFALKGVAEIKSGAVLKGIFNQFSWVVILIGLLFLSPNLMIFLGAIDPNPVPAWFDLFSKIGIYVALVGFGLLLIGGAVGKKNPIKMVAGALGNVYGGINVVSDLLSYSRLFGLGLTTGVIGYAVNLLADIIVTTFFGGLWIGWVVAAPVLVVGHAFNLAINLLGTYVHNSRLQYIEFFGRFYEATGRAFNPVGSKTKYTYLDA